MKSKIALSLQKEKITISQYFGNLRTINEHAEFGQV